MVPLQRQHRLRGVSYVNSARLVDVEIISVFDQGDRSRRFFWLHSCANAAATISTTAKKEDNDQQLKCNIGKKLQVAKVQFPKAHVMYWNFQDSATAYYYQHHRKAAVKHRFHIMREQEMSFAKGATRRQTRLGNADRQLTIWKWTMSSRCGRFALQNSEIWSNVPGTRIPIGFGNLRSLLENVKDSLWMSRFYRLLASFSLKSGLNRNTTTGGRTRYLLFDEDNLFPDPYPGLMKSSTYSRFSNRTNTNTAWLPLSSRVMHSIAQTSVTNESPSDIRHLHP